MKKLLILGFMLLATQAMACSGKPFEMQDPFVRATKMGVSSGYVLIHNPQKTDDVLQSAKADGVGRIELHTVRENSKGVMEMRHVKSFAIPAKGDLALRPNGNHLMLFDVKQPLKAGDKLKIMLHFKHAGDVPMHFKVQPLTYQGGDKEDHAQHNMHH